MPPRNILYRNGRGHSSQEKGTLLKTLSIICALAIGLSESVAQGFFSDFLRADTLFTEGKFLESARLYVSVLSRSSDIPNGAYIAAAMSYAMAGSNDSAFVLIDQGVLHGFNQLEVLQKDSSLVTLRRNPQWASRMKGWEERIQRSTKELNKSLQEELLQMGAEDQQVRKSLPPPTDSANTKVIATAFEKIDRKHSARMWEILRQYGWPGYSLVGQEGAGAAWLLVQHADLDTALQDTSLMLLSAAAKNGDASFSNVAYLTDRVLTNQGKKQIFGTQTHWDSASSGFVPDPIEDEANVDSRREKAGLGPLAEYLRFLLKMYVGK